ncbi:MAG: DUF362 domain-containing protein [Planctomycetota bacterium]|nr:MAG: DUF362 domain-containing protein [Planctomycetota bacterium]
MSRHLPNPTVALTQCGDYSQAKIARAIAEQFELCGGLEKFVKPGDSVLLKPNLIAPRSRRHAAQTDPAVIIETARLLKDFGAKPFVGDSPAWGSVFGCIKALKLAEPLERLGVPVKPLIKPRICRVGVHNTKVGISSAALDADVIINLPKFKTHQQLVATFAVKNMFGTVTGKRKALWHFVKGKKPDDFCELLIAIFKFLNPALTIIDAVTVMDGPGPIRGRARPLGYLIGGTDPVACETLCCKLVDIEPEDLPIIRAARQADFGCSEPDRIKVVGDSLPEQCRDFELPRLIPIRFSLVHVCKSICKQLLLLTKQVIEGKRPS